MFSLTQQIHVKPSENKIDPIIPNHDSYTSSNIILSLINTQNISKLTEKSYDQNILVGDAKTGVGG